MGLVAPIAGPYTETQGFFGYSGGHPGVDLAAPTGTPVIAPLGGTIAIAGYDTGGFGNWIVEHLSNGWYAVFGHLSAENVRIGQTVTQGQQIGAVGSTGDSTGPHLHYQLETGGPPPVPSAQLIDPQPYLTAYNGTPTQATLTSASTSSAPSSGGWPGGNLSVIPSWGLFPGLSVSKSTVTRIALMVVGIALLLIAVSALAESKPGQGPITVIRTGTTGARRNTGPSRLPPKAAHEQPLSSQDVEDLNTGLRAKRLAHEGSQTRAASTTSHAADADHEAQRARDRAEGFKGD